MIDPKQFTVEQIIDAFFGDIDSDWGHEDWWKRYAVIIPDWMPKYPRNDTTPICVVRFCSSYLRHSKGPRQGHFWDSYPDDYHNVGLALRALFEAPIAKELINGGIKCRDLWEQKEAHVLSTTKKT